MWKCIIYSPEFQSFSPGAIGYPGTGGYAGGSGLFPGAVNPANIGMLNPGGPGDLRPNRRPGIRFTTPRPGNNIQEVSYY